MYTGTCENGFASQWPIIKSYAKHWPFSQALLASRWPSHARCHWTYIHTALCVYVQQNVLSLIGFACFFFFNLNVNKFPVCYVQIWLVLTLPQSTMDDSLAFSVSLLCSPFVLSSSVEDLTLPQSCGWSIMESRSYSVGKKAHILHIKVTTLNCIVQLQLQF